MMKMAIVNANDQTEVVEPVNPLIGKFMNMSTPGEDAGGGDGSPMAGIASALSKKPTTAKVRKARCGAQG